MLSSSTGIRYSPTLCSQITGKYASVESKILKGYSLSHDQIVLDIGRDVD